jgi:4-hydroxy-2-oxoheptanedioate aldolase
MDSTTFDVKDRGYNFKQEMLSGSPKFGLFINSGSPVIAEQLSYGGYDWLLVDTQHGPMDSITLASMLSAISNGNCLSMVRVGGAHDRIGIQQALDCGANGILIPYVNTREEAEEGVTCCYYPTKGTRSVYFPQRCMNEEGLLGYAGRANKNVIVAVQVETADCIKNIDDIASLPGIDILFLGQNDLCMSMGLYEKYKFPDMYTSEELGAATDKLVKACQVNKVIPGVFLFGTDRVGEFVKRGFPFISIGNDLHHVMTSTNSYVEKLTEITKGDTKTWKKNE